MINSAVAELTSHLRLPRGRLKLRRAHKAHKPPSREVPAQEATTVMSSCFLGRSMISASASRPPALSGPRLGPRPAQAFETMSLRVFHEGHLPPSPTHGIPQPLRHPQGRALAVGSMDLS